MLRAWQISCKSSAKTKRPRARIPVLECRKETVRCHRFRTGNQKRSPVEYIFARDKKTKYWKLNFAGFCFEDKIVGLCRQTNKCSYQCAAGPAAKAGSGHCARALQLLTPSLWIPPWLLPLWPWRSAQFSSLFRIFILSLLWFFHNDNSYNRLSSLLSSREMNI